MKLQVNPSLPADLQQQVLRVWDLLRSMATQVNLVTEGRAAAIYNAQPTVPT